MFSENLPHANRTSFIVFQTRYGSFEEKKQELIKENLTFFLVVFESLRESQTLLALSIFTNVTRMQHITYY